MRSTQPHSFARFFAALLIGTLLTPPAFADDMRHKPAAERSVSAAGEALNKPAEEIRPGLAGSFLSGRFARHHQDMKEAAKFLNDTLAQDPTNEPLKHEALRANLVAGDLDTAVALAKQLDPLSDSVVVSVLLVDRVNAGDYRAAKDLVAKAPSAGLFGLVRPLMTQWLMIADGETKDQVNLQPAIDKAGFFAPFIRYQEALMDDVLANPKAAAAAYEKAVSDPAVTPYRVVQALANFDARQGKWMEAQSAFDAYARANPDSTLIPDKLEPGDPAAVAPLVADAKQGLAELFFTTASIIFGEDSSQDTFVYLRIALSLRPDLPPAQLMLANLEEQVGDYNAAVATYDGIDPKSVFFRRGQVRKALNYEAMGQKEKALELLENLAKIYPKDATALITRGDMLRELERYDEAADAYTAAITRSEPLAAGDWPLLYARGISYERTSKWEQAEADFNRALTLQPNQPDVLNYLAYSWLTQNKNTDKAHQYLETALAERPDDPHIIDSVGWSRYLAGDYPGAVAQLEKAVDRMPDDVTVNDHLGDAYWRVGRQIEARFQWQRALNFKPEKDVAEALKTKIDRGLPVSDAPASAANPTTVGAAPAVTQTP